MKMLKKTLCVVLSAVLAALSLSVAAFAEDGEPVLKFGEDGKFKIMVFADIQDDEDVEETTLQLMNEALDKYAPDLVIYLGDNTVADGYDNQYAAIKTITEPCVTRGVPYGIVFGNHDQEHDVSKEELLEIYREFGCLTYDADPDMYGCGTCSLPILSSDGTKVAFNLWLTDSGSKNTDEGASGYDYVHEDQIQWYKNTAARLKAENGGETVPAINFQHIVIPEVYEAMYPALPFKVGTKTTFKGVTYFPVPKFSTHTGFVFEMPCPPYVADGQYDAWVETGDIKAAFFGHDHTNSYTVNIGGIDITNVPTAGCNSYSSDIDRGVGLITLDENDASYEYELINIYDMALADGSRITKVDGGKSRAYYKMTKLFSEFLTLLHSLFIA